MCKQEHCVHTSNFSTGWYLAKNITLKGYISKTGTFTQRSKKCLFHWPQTREKYVRETELRKKREAAQLEKQFQESNPFKQYPESDVLAADPWTEPWVCKIEKHAQRRKKAKIEGVPSVKETDFRKFKNFISDEIFEMINAIATLRNELDEIKQHLQMLTPIANELN